MCDQPISHDLDDHTLLEHVVEYYHRALCQNPQALDYLRGRGIRNSEVVEHFTVGFADRTFGKHLPPTQVRAGQEVRARLRDLGILRDTGHEHFRGSLTFPVRNADGRIVGIYGRKTGQGLRPGTPLHTHLTDPPRGVWNLDALRATSEVILCGSLFDALTFWAYGYRNVTCMFGPDHIDAFQEFGTTRVISAVDTAVLGDLDVEVFEINLPVGLDVNEYALQAEKPIDALGALIRHATWVRGEAAAPVPERAASPVPAPPEKIPCEVTDEQITFTLGDRRYRVRGLSRNQSFDQMRVNLLASNPAGMFVDTFDLYSARHRTAFVQQAATELAVEVKTIKRDVGRVLLQLETLQATQADEPREAEPELTETHRAEALAFLRDPDLLERIVADFDVVGERTNKLVGYLAAVSRKLEEPLAVVVQSSSSAGKTSLMEAVLSFVPPEDRVKYSTMTGQSLYYMGEQGLQHKILAIVEEEGAARAGYALKLLQSEGELTIASTGKDPSTGRLVTQEYRVEGPVMIFLTTTSIEIDEELLNRCLVLTVDEDRAQTRAIHEAQRRRETLEGLLHRQDRRATIRLHQNVQRLLRPILVANPYAEQLTFLDDKTRTRRDHVKYLTLIRVVALLHQHQRPVRIATHGGGSVEYIEVTPDDIAVANEIAHEVLGRSLDELPPQTRRLLTLVTEMIDAECVARAVERCDMRFSRRDVRDHTAWGQTQLKVHLKRLEELEYLLVHRGGRGQSFVYELLVGAEVDPQERVLARLLDVDVLRNLSGPDEELSGEGRGVVGPKSGGSRGEDACVTDDDTASSAAPATEVVQNPHRGTVDSGRRTHNEDA